MHNPARQCDLGQAHRADARGWRLRPFEPPTHVGGHGFFANRIDMFDSFRQVLAPVTRETRCQNSWWMHRRIQTYHSNHGGERGERGHPIAGSRETWVAPKSLERSAEVSRTPA